MSEKGLTHGIRFKDKIGYAMGDMGGLLTFSLIGAFQNKFYTDVLHIQPGKIVVLILVARLWDAINDPIWGAFIDSRKPTKQGKFRPYVFWFSIPLAVSAVLMFTVIPNLSEAKYLLFAYITYILYGMMYTAVNIPYGSLASVVTDDEKSVLRFQCGAQSARASAGFLAQFCSRCWFTIPQLPQTAPKFKLLTAQSSQSVLRFWLLFPLRFISGIISSPKKELRPLKRKKAITMHSKQSAILQKQTFCYALPCLNAAYRFPVLLSINISISFADYYHSAKLYSMVTICTYLPMAILIPIMNKLIDKFGKKSFALSAWALRQL